MKSKTIGLIFQSFTTLDIVLMAMLATANAVVTMYLSTVNQLLNSAGGPIATSTITGIYMLYGVLACYIIRKPGTAIITFSFGAIVQSFLGVAYGIPSAIAAALCYMVVVEVILALFRYKRWDYISMSILGGAMVPIWFYFAAQMFGYTKWGTSILMVALVVRIISGMILAGYLSKVLGDLLAKSGLLSRFSIGSR
jgi:energy-coupling factor transport system substrate-specific component